MFVIIHSFFVYIAVDTLTRKRPIRHGVYTPYADRNNSPIVGSAWRLSPTMAGTVRSCTGFRLKFPAVFRGGKYEGCDLEVNHGNQNKDADAGTASQHRCLLARRQLSRGRSDLSLRQPAVETTAGARRCEAHAPGTLGHDSRPELHLHALEPGHQKIRPRHDLRLRSGTRRPRCGGQYLP